MFRPAGPGSLPGPRLAALIERYLSSPPHHGAEDDHPKIKTKIGWSRTPACSVVENFLQVRQRLGSLSMVIPSPAKNLSWACPLRLSPLAQDCHSERSEESLFVLRPLCRVRLRASAFCRLCLAVALCRSRLQPRHARPPKRGLFPEPSAIFFTSFWRSYRGGHTRSHPEHGS